MAVRASGWIRTSGLQVRNLMLSPLSYEGEVRAEGFEPPERLQLGYSQPRLSSVGAPARDGTGRPPVGTRPAPSRWCGGGSDARIRTGTRTVNSRLPCRLGDIGTAVRRYVEAGAGF